MLGQTVTTSGTGLTIASTAQMFAEDGQPIPGTFGLVASVGNLSAVT
jgi:hypothetical protein